MFRTYDKVYQTFLDILFIVAIVGAIYLGWRVVTALG